MKAIRHTGLARCSAWAALGAAVVGAAVGRADDADAADKKSPSEAIDVGSEVRALV